MPRISISLIAAGAMCASSILAQDTSPTPVVPAPAAGQTASAPAPSQPAAPDSAPVNGAVAAANAPAPIDPVVAPPSPDGTLAASAVPGGSATAPAPVVSGSGDAMNIGSATSKSLNEFQGDDIAQVLRLLARQAKINLVVSDKVAGTITMRLEDKTPLETIQVIVDQKGLIMDERNGVYSIKTQDEKKAEPAVSDHYTFSYAQAKTVAPLLDKQLTSGLGSQVDERTNTIFYRETKSNMDKIKLFLDTIDRPTRQVMIEARLVEVTANPKQSYGVNWSGVVGSSSAPQTFRYGGSTPGSSALVASQSVTTSTVNGITSTTTTPLYNAQGAPIQTVQASTLPGIQTTSGNGSNILNPTDFLLAGQGKDILSSLEGQFAILSAPAMSLTLRLLNEDSDAEFLANPRIVTADNQKATIKITENQPVPQLNFNEQTATAVFGGFQDKEYGNTLEVTPSINKDDFVTLQVSPEISNKVSDATFVFAGATVSSPIIDKRSLTSNVLIKSGDTLAIGGLLQDQTIKGTTKVPVLGDIPMVGYLFQEHLNSRSKRNLLIFVTPTIIKPGYGTGLEDQVSGLHHTGEEYADPNGWRNNAKGSIRLVPTSNRQIAADYPKPGTPLPAGDMPVKYKTSATGADN